MTLKHSEKSIRRRENNDEKATNFPPTIPPLLQKIYQNRSVSDFSEIEKSLSKLRPYHSLKGIDDATNLLYKHLCDQSHIVIIGDFDADGATSTTVAVKCLRMLGASYVDFLVPDRFKYGYGLTPEIVKAANEKYSPDLIVTVDNGISSVDGVAAALEANIEVLVTDHHLAGNTLPNAHAIVNPNQPGDIFPSKNLAGVGVIFYVMLALRNKLRERNWFQERNIPQPNLSSVLDIVALGTVADVVPLDLNNRILVNQGLKRVRVGEACPGIKALIEISGRNERSLVATDFGFSLGPRLNAAGRLEDMAIGINCLLSDNLQQARMLASQLDALNSERKEIESQMQLGALETLAQLNFDENELPMGMCLYDESWHQGVIGILASRIKDKLHRPVIIFAKGDNGEIKGSARSIPGIHIRDILDSVATNNPGLITKFGGHAMAAGLSISENAFRIFQSSFDAEVSLKIKPEYLEQVILSDGELKDNELTLSMAELLKNAEPWGQAFPEPIFDGIFSVTQRRVVGEKHLKLQLQPANSNLKLEAIAFNAIDPQDAEIPFDVGSSIQAAYKLDVNEFRGNRTLQLIIDYLEVT
ncbi:MAG: single-stranded-DNA-specific exonuclease RecJ [Gammaproteobacteria bacterium]|nr:single-stranded-DNA-specific exonuclease RecJ [Gammaproteobacteria bacterium]